jgi:hypothetical protein
VAGSFAFLAELYKGRRERMHGAVFAFPRQDFVSIMRFAVQVKKTLQIYPLLQSW